MPTPLYIWDLVNAELDTERGTDQNGYQYSFRSTDNLVSFGIVDDYDNNFNDGSSSASLKPLKVDISLVNDEALAIQDFDYMALQVRRTIGSDEVDYITLWLPAETGTGPLTLYIDSDGNTYTDEALTTAAGGVALLSDSLAASDAIGNYEYETSFEDEFSVTDSLTLAIQALVLSLQDSIEIVDNLTISAIVSMIINLDDVIGIEDNLTISRIVSMIVSLSDSIEISDAILYSAPLWSEETAGTSTWVEE